MATHANDSTSSAATRPATQPAPRPRSKSTFSPLPTDPDALGRKEQCCEFLGMGASRFYQLIAEGKLPSPIKLGRSSFWRVGEFREAVKKLTEAAQ